MNLKGRIRLLESRMAPRQNSAVLSEIYLATHQSTDESKRAGVDGPLPAHEIAKIPGLARALESTSNSERDQKILESLRVLVSGENRRLQSDQAGSFILLASLAGVIEVRGVLPNRQAFSRPQ